MNDDDFAQLRKVITATLNDGNPFSTIEWEFYSEFADLTEKNRTDFCDCRNSSHEK